MYDKVKLQKSERFGNFKGTQTILSFFGLVQYPLCLFNFLKTTTELNSPNFSRTRLYRAKLSRPGKRVTLPAESTLARKVDLFARVKSLKPRADSSACACSDCLPLIQLTELTPKCLYGEKLTLPSKKGDPARWVTLIAEPTLFCSSCSCEQIAKFVRKCRKRWFAQGSSG